MARKVAFIGNCQIGTLGRLYQRFVCPENGDEASYTAGYLEAPEEQKRRIAEADVVVRQILDWVPKIGEIVVKNAQIVLVPHVTGAFMWPYGGEQHVRTPAGKLDEFRPYPVELGDTFLNRLILQGVDPEDALTTYLAIDVAKRAERLFEIHLDKQRNRDQLSGFNLAPFIEANFRNLQLFDSTNHPNGNLMPELVRPVFSELGVAASLVETAASQAAELTQSEAPIHPGVASHFGLSYAGPGRRYRYFQEGGFTFEESVRRYMKYEHNKALRYGVHLAGSRQDEAAAAVLSEALPRSPQSIAGRRAFIGVLVRLERFADAVEVAEQLVALEPDSEAHAKLLRGMRGQLAKFERSQPPAIRAPLATRPNESLAR